jgi:TnpA family transposase
MKRQWTPDDLAEHWTLHPDDLALLTNQGAATRLGCALLLKYFQHDGRFPQHKGDIPPAAIVHVAHQLGVPPEFYTQYDWSGRTIERHRAGIRQLLSFRESTDQDIDTLTAWLRQDVLPHEHRPDRLQEAVYAHCRATQLEPPAPKRVERLVRSALRSYEEQVQQQVLARLQASGLAQIDSLLTVPEDNEEAAAAPPADPHDPGQLRLRDLKADPGRASLESMLVQIVRLRRIRQVALPEDLFAGVSAHLVEAYRQRAAAEPPSELHGHADPVRATLLGALCLLRRQEITDGLVDLLIATIHKFGSRADERVSKELLTEIKRVSGKTTLLYQLAEAAVAHPEGVVRDVLYPVVAEKTLRELVAEYKAHGPGYTVQVQTRIHASYGQHYRRLLPDLLNVLEFRSNNDAHRPVIQALDLLKRYVSSSKRYFARGEEVPIAGVVPEIWLETVLHADRKGRVRVQRINYEVCVLQSLRECLRCKEIWVVGADRYRNADDDLPADFAAQRDLYYDALHLPQDADVFITGLRDEMAIGLETLNREMPKNPGVRVVAHKKGGGRLKVTPLEALPEPPMLASLKSEVGRRWSMTGLLDMLKEADLRVDFTRAFSSVASREVLDPDTLRRRLLLCLFALATNTGLKRIAASDQSENYADLRYVLRRFITREHLRTAIAQVASATFATRNPLIWGEATTTCASDSKKLGAWDQNLRTEYSQRHFGAGVMVYWHVEKKSVCIYSKIKTVSSSEVAAMIEGVLRHCTTMSVEKNFVDSHGQSEIAFAFTRLLGFQLMPRLKRIGKQKLYLPIAGAKGRYAALEPVLTRPIRWELIRQQYDEIIKFTTALRLGTAEPEAILRRFTRTDVQHPTYAALLELGRAVKTVFLCAYLREEAVRREVHVGLEVIENWNGANSFIHYGRGGEITTNRLDTQGLAVLCMTLVQNAMCLINTLMLQRVLAEPAWLERMTPADWRGLTPLIYAHVNPYGLFLLDMNQRLSLGEEAAG